MAFGVETAYYLLLQENKVYLLGDVEQRRPQEGDPRGNTPGVLNPGLDVKRPVRYPGFADRIPVVALGNRGLPSEERLVAVALRIRECVGSPFSAINVLL
ncbi:hypothetical protein MRX96_045687 [Rhipicephalus microplus]